MIKKINVAVDGPVGSGKTTIGKLLAQRLDYNFFDSGLLYRHFAQFYHEKFVIDHLDLPINPLISSFSQVDEAISLWQKLLANNRERLENILEKEQVSLNSSIVSDLASRLSPAPKLRKIILDFQRELTKNFGWVVVGRDITSEVLPDAKIKIFLTASLESRAKRRYEQYQGKMSQYEVEEELRKRDERDTKRVISPLKKTADSYELDTTCLSLEEVAKKILGYINVEIYGEEKNSEN